MDLQIHAESHFGDVNMQSHNRYITGLMSMLQAQEAAFEHFVIGPYGMPGTSILSTKILRL